MPAPIKWLNDFELVNAENPEGEPWLSASPDGRFSLMFYETLLAPTVHTDLEERVFSAAGTNPASIGTTFSSSTIEHQVASAWTPDGRRIIVWTEEPEAGGGNQEDVYAQIYFGNNIIDVPRFLVSGGVGRQHDPVVAAGGTGFVVALADTSVEGGQLILRFYDIAGTLFNTVTNPNAPQTVGTGSADQYRDVEITVLANGNYVVVWDNGSNRDVFARVFSPGGTAQGGVIDVQTGGQAASFPDVTALADGGFVVTYAEFAVGNLFGRTYDAAGAAGGAVFPIGTGFANTTDNQAQTTALHDGRFVSVWKTAGGDIAGQVMFADGVPDGAEFTVNTDTAGDQSRPTIATLADGRFAVSWESGLGPAPETIVTTIFDPREEGITLIGTTAGDHYFGTAFADTILSGAGNDTIDGAAGDDTLDGGIGADLLTGGDGNDTYFVNMASDTATETNATLATGGNDLVQFTGISGTFTLSDNVERLTLKGVSAINGTGNTLANTLTGNAASNTLSGLSGNDTLDGGGGIDIYNGGTGNDTYIIRNAGTVIVESTGQGTADRVLAATGFILAADDNIEVMQTVSAAAATAINLTGNALSQSFFGNAGVNQIDGREGQDTMTGGAGADRFVFATAIATTNVDIITDFVAGLDEILLEGGFFTGIGNGGLAAFRFHAGASGQATTADVRIIYETDNGNLWYDADGNGAGVRVLFGDLAAGLGVTLNDFTVF